MAVYPTVLASFVFSLYLVVSPIHGVAYGSLDTAISLHLYLYFSAVVLLFGAKLNAELRRNALKEGGINDEAP